MTAKTIHSGRKIIHGIEQNFICIYKMYCNEEKITLIKNNDMGKLPKGIFIGQSLKIFIDEILQNILEISREYGSAAQHLPGKYEVVS